MKYHVPNVLASSRTMKRGWEAITLLYLIPFSSSLSTSFGGSSSNGGLPSTSSADGGGTRSTRREGDLYSEVVIHKRKPRRRAAATSSRSAAAPFVDSTLLRFLSEQKLERRTSTTEIISGTDETYLGQFNANRISQVLREHAVTPDVALEVGQAVQAHVLHRTTRRRVRDFLKQREKEWISRLPEAQPTLPPDYGFIDVIRMLRDYGFKGTDIAEVLRHTPGVALMRPKRISEHSIQSIQQYGGGETLQETLERSLTVLQSTLQLRRYDARRIVRTCPGLLTVRGSKRAENVVVVLQSLGVSPASLRKERMGLPSLLARSPANLFRLAAFLASDAIRMPIRNIGPLLRRPESMSLLDEVAPVENIVTDQQLQRQRVNEVYLNMAKTAWTLRHEIGTHDLGKVVSAYPCVLLLDAETQVLPMATYLMEELGIYELPKVLQLYPFLLGRTKGDLQRVVNYLIHDLAIAKDDLPGILRAFPSLLTMNIEKTMVPVVDFLKEIGVSNVGRFVTRLPPILGYSVEEELRPKWDYLSQVCLYPSFELSAFPAYFSYPLDRVIKTRYEYLRFVKQLPTQLLALDLVVRFGDKDFSEKVAKDDDGGATFREFVSRRQMARSRQSGTIRYKKV